MEKNKTQKTKPTVKHEKPLKLDMSFDEAIKRITRVEPQKKK
jgi:hypothetical protein